MSASHIMGYYGKLQDIVILHCAILWNTAAREVEGLYREHAKVHGNYHNMSGYILGFYIGIMEKNIETTIVDCCCYSCNCDSFITVQTVVPASCLLLVHDNLAPRAFCTSLLCGKTLNPKAEDYSDGAAKPSLGHSHLPQAARYP